MPNELKAIALKNEINAHHRECLKSAGDAVHHALECGRLLCEAKAEIEHGQWTAWVEQYCDFSYRTARDYVQAFKVHGLLGHKLEVPATSISQIKNLLPAPERTNPSSGVKLAGVATIPPPVANTNQGLGSVTDSEPVEDFTASDTDGTDVSTEAAGGDFPSDRCPACNLVRWEAVEEGFQCGSCGHWHGEPVAEDEPEDARWTDEAKKMRAKLRKTLESGQRAVDDLQAEIRDNERHRLILAAIGDCLEFTKEWASV